MTIRLLDPYHPGAGPLHRADPRLKLVAALGWILLINVTPAGRWPLYVAHLLAWLGVMLASRVPPWAVARRSLVALPFVLLAALGAPWGVDGHAVWTGDLFGWRLALTDAGLLRLATILARAWLSVLVAVGLGATTHVVAVVRAARALGLPAVLAAVILLMYRYLYVLVDEAGRLMRARDARSAVCAGRRAGRSLGWRARVTGHMIATLFLRTYERGERMYQAMLARGYTGDPGAFGTSAGGLPAHAEEYAPEEVSAGGPGGEPMIEVQDLAYTYPDGHAALRGVSLSVAPGEKVAIVGPNGAGKSTLLLHLNGLLRGEGRVRVAGLEVDERTARRVRARVGLVFQDPDDQLFSPTVLDDVAFGPLHMGLADAEALGRSAWALGLPADGDIPAFGRLAAGEVAALRAFGEALPEDAVVLASLHSGAVERYAGRPALRPAAWSDAELARALAALEAAGRPAVLLVDGEETRDDLHPRLVALAPLTPRGSLPIPLLGRDGSQVGRGVAVCAAGPNAEGQDSRD